MAIRLVSGAGNVEQPSFISMYASGVIQRNSLVDLPKSSAAGANGFTLLSPASSSSTTTTIFGVSLDYVQGASDTFIKVIPFNSNEIFEVDCVSAVSTAQIGIKHQMYNSLLVNNTSYNQSGVTGVFLALNMTSGTTGSGKLIGQFVNSPILLQNGVLTF